MKVETALAYCPGQPKGTTPVIGRQHGDVWVIADAAGNQARATLAASRAVAAALSQNMKSQALPARLRASVETANAAVFEEELPAPACLTHATSLVIAAISEERLVLAHVGSARCYRFRAGNRALLTRPHVAMASHELDARALSETHDQHFVTRALGLTRSVEPETSEHVLRQGDLLVLVNDTLSPLVEGRDVAELFIHGTSVATFASTVARLGAQHGVEGVVIALGVADPHLGIGEPFEEA